MMLTQTCDRCGRVEAFPEPPPEHTDHWTLGPDGWLLVLVNWDGFLACDKDHDPLSCDRCDFDVLHVCPDCATEADQDEPHMSWRLQSGAAALIAD